MQAVRWLAICAILAAPAPALADDLALEAGIRALRDGVADPAICSGPLCPRVLPILERALAMFPLQRPSLALIYASSGLLLLERYKLVSGGLEPAIDELLARARARVLESRSEAETAIGRLCSGVRPVSRRGLIAPERYLATAAAQVTSGQSAMALRWLGVALTSYDAAKRLAALLQTRCRPRVCPGNAAPGFTPGDPANASIELIPPDRGTLVDYEGIDHSESEAFRGRVVFLGLSIYRVSQVFGPANDPIRLDDTVSLGSCRDPAGWDRRISLTESAILRHVASGLAQRLSASLRAAQPIAVFPSGSFSLPPFGASMRVGDQIAQPGVVVSGRVFPGGAVLTSCDFTHEVSAIETRTVAAGTFEAAKLESTVSCAGDPLERITTWVASEIGEIESQTHDASGNLLAEAAAVCFETPETAGRCAAP